MASELGRSGTTPVVAGPTGVGVWLRAGRAEGWAGSIPRPTRPTIAAARQTAPTTPATDEQPPPALTSACFADDDLVRDEVGSRILRQRGSGAGHNGDTMVVTMRDVKVDRNDSTPLHERVAAEIRRDIANGDVRPGERLPPAHDMAAVLGVHTNTVLRALRTLRDDGVLQFRRGPRRHCLGRTRTGCHLGAGTGPAHAGSAVRAPAREDVVAIIESLS